MPAWLWRSIVATAFAVSILSIGQWASCRFYVLPSLWPMYINGQQAKDGKPVEPPSMGCADADTRTVAVMMGVLTTLISLSRKAE